jgi:hypothetical protein
VGSVEERERYERRETLLKVMKMGAQASGRRYSERDAAGWEGREAEVSL